LIESKFYRLSPHGNAITVPPVPTQFQEHEAVEVYGNKAEFEAGKAKDPLPKFRSQLVANATFTDADAKRIEEASRVEMEDVVKFALASPLPRPEDAVNYVYA
jgi:TPP-dependent pyruvate/acetoin dehydrogenase alpha subunit